MNAFFAQCSATFSADLPVIGSVMLAGLVGSVSHCSIMCAPLAAAQMMRIHLSAAPQSLMAFYHIGRIATYIILGVMALSLSRWIFAGIIQPYVNALLVLAGSIFFVSAVLPRKTHACCSNTTHGIQKWLNELRWQRIGYLLRGMLMGLMPCGMVYAVLIVVATLETQLNAAIVMLLFGMTTLPTLQLTGLAALSLGKKYPQIFAPLSRGVMAINGLFLCGIGMNAVGIS